MGLGGQACCCSTELAISDSPKACFSWVSTQTQVTRRLAVISLLNPFYWAICSELRCVLLLGVIIPLSRLLARHRLRPSQLLLLHTIKPSHLLTSGESEMSAGPWASGPQLNGNPRGLVPCSAFFRSQIVPHLHPIPKLASKNVPPRCGGGASIMVSGKLGISQHTLIPLKGLWGACTVQ